MDKKNKKIVLILGIIGLLFILVGVTFAIFYSSLFGITPNRVVYGEDIIFSYNESAEGITLTNNSKMSDANGKIQNEYFDFSVSLTSNTLMNVNYTIYITKDEVTRPINDNYIKLYLTDQSNNLVMDTKSVSELQLFNDTAGSYVLYNTNLSTINDVLKTDLYRLRIWVSDEMDQDSTYQTTHNDGSHVTSSMEFNYQFKVNVESKENLDRSGANGPDLATGMIPVYYDGTVWRKADSTNTNSTYRWYSYESSGATKGMWANAVTVADINRDTLVNSPIGTEIPMSDINTMWVWIPRFNVNTGELTTQAYFESIRGTATMGCSNTTYTTESDCTLNSGTWTNNYLTPGAINVTYVNTSTPSIDAFWWDEDSDGIQDVGEQKAGFWYGKFETSSDIECIAAYYSAVGSGCNLATIKPKIIPNVISWIGAQVATYFNASRSMEATNNMYGFVESEVDTHMSKNNEWGAVAYLTQSIYGRCSNSTTCTEVTTNNCSTYTTGIGGDAVDAGESSITCTTPENQYNGAKGVLASTTGTIYGIYDMSGGLYEYVMGNYNNILGWKLENNSHSGFNGAMYEGEPLTTGTPFPESKYVNIYTGTSYIGHDLNETAGWYSDSAYFMSSKTPWLMRGGYWYNTNKAGLFASNSYYGNAGNGSCSRFALVK